MIKSSPTNPYLCSFSWGHMYGIYGGTTSDYRCGSGDGGQDTDAVISTIKSCTGNVKGERMKISLLVLIV